MTILFVDEDGVTLALTQEDGDMYLTISKDEQENTIMIDDPDKFIKAINFVMGKVNSQSL